MSLCVYMLLFGVLYVALCVHVVFGGLICSSVCTCCCWGSDKCLGKLSPIKLHPHAILPSLWCRLISLGPPAPTFFFLFLFKFIHSFIIYLLKESVSVCHMWRSCSKRGQLLEADALCTRCVSGIKLKSSDKSFTHWAISLVHHRSFRPLDDGAGAESERLSVNNLERGTTLPSCQPHILPPPAPTCVCSPSIHHFSSLIGLLIFAGKAALIKPFVIVTLYSEHLRLAIITFLSLWPNSLWMIWICSCSFLRNLLYPIWVLFLLSEPRRKDSEGKEGSMNLEISVTFTNANLRM